MICRSEYGHFDHFDHLCPPFFARWAYRKPSKINGYSDFCPLAHHFLKNIKLYIKKYFFDDKNFLTRVAYIKLVGIVDKVGKWCGERSKINGLCLPTIYIIGGQIYIKVGKNEGKSHNSIRAGPKIAREQRTISTQQSAREVIS